MKKIVFALPLLWLLACQQKEEKKSVVAANTKDPHTLSQPEKAVVKHLELGMNVDFTTRQLTAKASWTIENIAKGDEIIFDTRQLQIEKVTLGEDEKETNFKLGKNVAFLGRALSVHIAPTTTKVNIYYRTDKNAAALQWLNPQQTAGKKLPFLFTQSEAILARTWIPCQDSPGIRFTYNAEVIVPANLLALMSAVNPQKKSAIGTYHFTQSHAIPSYLMALAVGDIDFKAIDKRTGVYAEPVVLQKAAWEFADMGKMVTAAENIYGPYRWGRYDLLVLPPSFPFGGMENPMLTFATPTVIAGDRSLVNLVAHELAHSWSGNLVTNATWNDFWLNEGFTTYFEKRITEAVYGVPEKEMQEVLAYQDLKDEVAELGADNALTTLKTDLAGHDPDEGMTTSAYEKGYYFLRKIEEVVGRPKFDAFLKNYFDRHAFQSMTTEKFLDYLKANLIGDDKSISEKIDIDAWVYQPGIPKNITMVSSSAFNNIDSLLTDYAKTKVSKGLNKKIRSTSEILYFIRHLPKDITVADMTSLDQEFGFTKSGNAEIQCVWYTLAIRQGYKPAYANMELFLTQIGRRKFLIPLYKELIKTPDGKSWAKRIYEKARPNYHSVAYQTIDELLK
ncbi:MAG: M1 family metallopeptidase [Sphingobacteriaceae bacterium]